MLSSLVIATHNSGKWHEFQALFAPYHIQVHAQSAWVKTAIDEPFTTFVENALAKARHAAQASGLPALADDSGICATALHGAPGIHSARFAAQYAQYQAGDIAADAANNHYLNQCLQNQEDKRVYYFCALVFVRHAKDPTPIIAQGRLDGLWQTEPSGQNGFGYDPHFYLPSHACSVACLSDAEKNCISHRALATQALLAALTQQGLIAS